MKVVSILIPVYQNSHLTKDCIQSIYSTTKIPIELIIVDNASTDDTIQVLLELQNNKPDNIEEFIVIRNKENMGVVSAFNQGIKQFSGDYLLLQNNDCVMTYNWLEEMMEVISENEKIGIIGPLSNLFHGKTHPHPQLIFPGYKTIDDLEKFVSSLKEKQKAAFIETDYVFGHCMLISREVIQNIGGFDTRFGIGYFEEIDFCKRAKDKGFKVGVANLSFVHHIGNKTLDLLKIDREKLKEKNKQIFNEKWKMDFHDKL